MDQALGSPAVRMMAVTSTAVCAVLMLLGLSFTEPEFHSSVRTIPSPTSSIHIWMRVTCWSCAAWLNVLLSVLIVLLLSTKGWPV